MYTEAPVVELGLDPADDWLFMFERDPIYGDLFKGAFPGSAHPITRGNLVKALASFERSIISDRSPYDRYRFGGDPTALSDSAKRGEALFKSKRLSCSSCHGGFNFSDAVVTENTPPQGTQLHRVELFVPPARAKSAAAATSAAATSAAATPATAKSSVTTTSAAAAPRLSGRFKAPTLRNIALTWPYMHDGSVATLEEAVVHRNEKVNSLRLTGAERTDLIAFLDSLTNKALILDMRYENPWRKLVPGMVTW